QWCSGGTADVGNDSPGERPPCHGRFGDSLATQGCGMDLRGDHERFRPRALRGASRVKTTFGNLTARGAAAGVAGVDPEHPSEALVEPPVVETNLAGERIDVGVGEEIRFGLVEALELRAAVRLHP